MIVLNISENRRLSVCIMSGLVVLCLSFIALFRKPFVVIDFIAYCK
jgi:hypothetical protein